MNDGDQLLNAILTSRNADGGWPFRRGNSWTEPTALAVLALQTRSSASETRAGGLSWLAGRQASDGGWPPCDSVSTSTWVTSLALLCLIHEPARAASAASASRWLMSQIYADAPAPQRILQRWLDLAPSKAPGSSPWFPGTAGWVIPTALAILALSSVQQRSPAAELSGAIARSQEYLFSRRCSDGGWNHGGSSYRSENALSYGETTGIALLALHNYRSKDLAPALKLATQLIEQPDSPEGFSWLHMGLAAHGIVHHGAAPAVDLKNPRDVALRLIALSATNPLLSQK